MHMTIDRQHYVAEYSASNYNGVDGAVAASAATYDLMLLTYKRPLEIVSKRMNFSARSYSSDAGLEKLVSFFEAAHRAHTNQPASAPQPSHATIEEVRAFVAAMSGHGKADAPPAALSALRLPRRLTNFLSPDDDQQQVMASGSMMPRPGPTPLSSAMIGTGMGMAAATGSNNTATIIVDAVQQVLHTEQCMVQQQQRQHHQQAMASGSMMPRPGPTPLSSAMIGTGMGMATATGSNNTVASIVDAVQQLLHTEQCMLQQQQQQQQAMASGSMMPRLGPTPLSSAMMGTGMGTAAVTSISNTAATMVCVVQQLLHTQQCMWHPEQQHHQAMALGSMMPRLGPTPLSSPMAQDEPAAAEEGPRKRRAKGKATATATAALDAIPPLGPADAADASVLPVELTATLPQQLQPAAIADSLGTVATAMPPTLSGSRALQGNAPTTADVQDLNRAGSVSASRAGTGLGLEEQQQQQQDGVYADMQWASGSDADNPPHSNHYWGSDADWAPNDEAMADETTSESASGSDADTPPHSNHFWGSDAEWDPNDEAMTDEAAPESASGSGMTDEAEPEWVSGSDTDTPPHCNHHWGSDGDWDPTDDSMTDKAASEPAALASGKHKDNTLQKFLGEPYHTTLASPCTVTRG